MIIRRLLYCMACCLTVCLGACEDDITPEGDELDPNIVIRLDGLANPTDTLLIYERSSLYFYIDNEPSGYGDISWRLDGEHVDTGYEGEQRRIWLTPIEPYGQVRTLEGRLWVQKGSRIVCVARKSFKVRFIQADKALDIRQTVSEDGFLKIVWNNPGQEQAKVRRYEVSCVDKSTSELQTLVFNDPEHNYYVDKHYVAGEQRYEVTAYFENDRMWRQQETYQVKSPVFPEDGFILEAVGSDRVKVTAPPYPFMYAIRLGVAYTEPSRWAYPDDFPLEVDRRLFPNSTTVNLDYYSSDTPQFWPAWLTQQAHLQKTLSYDRIDAPEVWGYAYSIYDDEWYGILPNEIRVWKPGTLTEKRRIAHNLSNESLLVVSDSRSSRKLIRQDYNKLLFFKDGTFSDPHVCALKYAQVYPLVYTPGNRVLVWVTESGGWSKPHNYLLAFDADTGDYLFKYDLPEYAGCDVTLSGDLKYLAVSSSDRKILDVHELHADGSTSPVRSFSSAEIGNAAYFVFNPAESSELIIVGEPPLRVVNVLGGEPVKVNDSAWYLGRDPFTGNHYGKHWDASKPGIVVWDSRFTKELYAVPCDGKADYSLYRNILMSGPYYMNLANLPSR